MIERMAKAICFNVYRNSVMPDRQAYSDAQIAGYVDINWENHIGSARAALQEAREPTEGMLHPPGQGPIPFFDFHREDDARGIWQAMIDAALSEEARATVDAGSGPGTDNKTLTITHELGPDGEVREL